MTFSVLTYGAPQDWQTGVMYPPGVAVVYNGTLWRCLVAHESVTPTEGATWHAILVGAVAAVTSINGLTGAVTLAQGSNVTITDSGNTLTLAVDVGVSSVNSLAGAITLAQGSGITITSSVDTITIATP